MIVESVGVFGRDFRLFELELRLFILRNHDDVPLDSNNKSQMSERIMRMCMVGSVSI